jgi:hypothetical protein
MYGEKFEWLGAKILTDSLKERAGEMISRRKNFAYGLSHGYDGW